MLRLRVGGIAEAESQGISAIKGVSIVDMTIHIHGDLVSLCASEKIISSVAKNNAP